MTKSIEILQSAIKIQEDRGREYGGSIERSAEAVAIVFNAVTGRAFGRGRLQIDAADVLVLLQALKQVRLFSAPGFHADSAADNVSYGALLGEEMARRPAQAPKPKAWRSHGGSVVSDVAPAPDHRRLSAFEASAYGAQHMLCESATDKIAQALCDGLGYELMDGPPPGRRDKAAALPEVTEVFASAGPDGIVREEQC